MNITETKNRQRLKDTSHNRKGLLIGLWRPCLEFPDPAYCKFAFTFSVNRTEDIPASGSPGATFVDVLQVAVLQSPETAIGFQPERLHGTTIWQSAINHNIMISFFQQVADAWKEAKDSDKAVIAGESARPPN